MPGTENVRKQTTLGGAAGIALLGFALVYRFFPGLIHVQPQAHPPQVAGSATPPPIGVRSNPPPVDLEMGPPRSLAMNVPPPIELPTEPEIPPTANISKLLDQADAALVAGRLLDPDKDNALGLYQLVLAEEKTNRRALAGVTAVRTAVVAAATAALDQGDADEAGIQIAAIDKMPHDKAEVEPLHARLKVLRQVTPLLAQAAELLKQGATVAPEGDNALAVYRRVRELDPDNALAVQGLAQIQRERLDQALAEVAKDDFAAADRMLTTASSILPGSQALLDTRTRIEGVRRQRAETVLAQARSALDSGNADLAERMSKQAQAISADLPALNEFDEKLRNARLYASFRPGETITDPYLDRSGNAPALLVIPTGSFRMGSPDGEDGHRSTEEPQRDVAISAGFALGRTEVSVAQFREFVRATNYLTTAELEGSSSVYDENSGRVADKSGITWQDDYRGKRASDDLPVIHVSWVDAQAYLNWLSARSGKKYRLPSEAEFEYALRAGSTTRFWWGDGDPPRVLANVTGARDPSPMRRTWSKAFARYNDGFWGPAPLHSFPANPLGLFDIDGNVSEWTADCWHDNYIRAPRDSEAWVNPGCERHVVRGGSWGSDPDQVRSAFRLSALASTRSARLGFRVARDL
ncbi:MAG: SUMF1/EgtB/PvdO family nonheme iron enzyme [Tahibacter sp.]